MSNPPIEGDRCPKCSSELRVLWCAPCFGTGRSGKGNCKACGGKGTRIGCPNFRSHRPKKVFEWGRILRKRLALF
jgi:hypothetical protein